MWTFKILFDSTVLGSGVVSTALQCGAGRCPTDNLTLSTPVRITIEHSEGNEVMSTPLKITSDNKFIIN